MLSKKRAQHILGDREFWVSQGIRKEFLPPDGQHSGVAEPGGGSPARPTTCQHGFHPFGWLVWTFYGPDRHGPPRPVSVASDMMTDGITQLSNTGWLVTAGFATLPGRLVGPAHALLLTESLP